MTIYIKPYSTNTIKRIAAEVNGSYWLTDDYDDDIIPLTVNTGDVIWLNAILEDNCTFTMWSIQPGGALPDTTYNGTTYTLDKNPRYYIVQSSDSGKTIRAEAGGGTSTYTYRITFNANDGTGNVPGDRTATGTSPSVVMGDITGAVPTRTGYTFRGWSAYRYYNNYRIAYSSNSSHGGSADKNGVSAVPTSGSWTYADYCDYTGGNKSNTTLELYAQWESTQCVVSFNGNGASGGSVNSITTTNGTTIYLPYNTFYKNDSTYTNTITLNKNGGNSSTTYKYCEETVSYSFLYWRLNSTSGTAYDERDSFTPTEDTTFYASWGSTTSITSVTLGTAGTKSSVTANGYTVSFNANGGSSTPPSVTAIDETTYSFKNWNTSKNGSGTSYDSTTSYRFSSNITLYAIWTPTTIKGSVTLPNNSSISKPGYSLLGWSKTNGSTTADYAPGASYTPTSNITLYAVWGNSSTVNIYDGKDWLLAFPYIFVDGKWSQAIAYVYDGSEWRMCGGG